MGDAERLLDECMARLDNNDLSESDGLANSPEVALALALRCVTFPTEEVASARERVRNRVLATVTVDNVEPGVEQPERRITAARRPSSEMRRRRRAVQLSAVAAVFFIACALAWITSNVAGSAAPESPLYSFKRADEWIALHTAWSDARRGDVYATIASHRLTEARIEAEGHHDKVAQALTNEYDSAMRQLISLEGTMRSRHENTASVDRDIARSLNLAYATLQAAKRSGQTTLARALDTTTQTEQAAITRNNITLPSVGGQQPTSDPTAPVKSGYEGTPTAPTGGQTTPSPVRPTVTTTPGAGNGNGSGSGNGDGNGKNHHPTSNVDAGY